MKHKKSRCCWQSGYTLVEIMVIVAATGLIMTSVIGIVLGSFKAQNRNSSTKKVADNGAMIISELRKNVFNSSRNNISCSSDDKSLVTVKNIMDDGITELSCDVATNKIASTSAIGQDVLNTTEVMVTDCSQFVSCEEDTNGEISNLVFSFGLWATTSGVGASQTFNTSITLRN